MAKKNQGWINGLRRLGDEADPERIRMVYRMLEIDLADAADVQPKVVRQNAIEMLDLLGLKDKIIKVASE